MVGLLHSGQSGLGSSPTVVFLDTLSCHTVPLSTKVKWVPGNCEREGSVGCDGPASRRVDKAILLVASR